MAGTVTQTFGVSWSNGNAADSVSKAKEITADTGIVQSFTVAGGATNQEQQIGFDCAAVKGVLVTVEGDGTSDTDGAVTLKTNDSGSPAHTKAFAAGGGELFWSSRSPETNPFGSTDVTTTFWTNAGTVAATVKVRLLLNT